MARTRQTARRQFGKVTNQPPPSVNHAVEGLTSSSLRGQGVHMLNDPTNEELTFAVTTQSTDYILKKDLKERLYLDSYCADVRILYQKKSYKLHKIVLSQNSTFFTELFAKNPPTQQQREALEERVPEYVRNLNLQEFNLNNKLDMSLGMFDQLIAYMYRGSLRCPHQGNELRLLNAAQQLGMKSIVQLVKAYMGTYLNAMDAARIMPIAYENNDYHLYEVCLRIVCRKGDMIFKSAPFLRVNFVHVQNLIQSDYLSAAEFEVFQGVKKWIDQEVTREHPDSVDDMNKYKMELWKAVEDDIRWPMIEADCIYSEIEPMHIISPHLIEEAYAFQALSQGSEITPDELNQFLGYSKRILERNSGCGWKFDRSPNRHNPKLTVSDDGKTVSHQSSGHASVLANRGFKSGRQRWGVKIVGPAHWIGIGVIHASKAHATRLTNDYSNWYGCSSANQTYRMTGPLAKWSTGDVISCELKFTGQVATFSIRNGPGTQLTAQIPTNNDELIPVVNLFTSSNKVELVKR